MKVFVLMVALLLGNGEGEKNTVYVPAAVLTSEYACNESAEAYINAVFERDMRGEVVILQPDEHVIAYSYGCVETWMEKVI